MNCDVIFTAMQCEKNKILGKNVVVIDVLRATSVIVTALKNGATSVVTFDDIDKATAYHKITKNSILCGEQNLKKIDGFLLGNSPFEYKPSVVKGKEIILSTSNGTKAIENAKYADNLIIMCFLNINRVVKKLLEENKDVVFVCAGTYGKFSADDAICAGKCINYLTKLRNDLELSDASRFLKDYSNFIGNNLHTALLNTRHYRNLKRLRMDDDIDFCLQLNLYNVLPYYKDGKIYS